MHRFTFRRRKEPGSRFPSYDLSPVGLFCERGRDRRWRLYPCGYSGWGDEHDWLCRAGLHDVSFATRDEMCRVLSAHLASDPLPHVDPYATLRRAADSWVTCSGKARIVREGKVWHVTSTLVPDCPGRSAITLHLASVIAARSVASRGYMCLCDAPRHMDHATAGPDRRLPRSAAS